MAATLPGAMRFFNTTGPVKQEDHYCLPPLERLKLEEILPLIEQERYFVLHAPRQTGKTSCLLALRDYLNAQGRFRCVYMNVELGQSARENVAEAMRAILSELASRARYALHDEFVDTLWPEILMKSGPHSALNEVLTRWTGHDPRPLVVLIDEIDALIGDTLIAVLRQIRSGYDKRPQQFPQSVVLCGVREVRDYRIHSSTDKAIITGAVKIWILYDRQCRSSSQHLQPESRERVILSAAKDLSEKRFFGVPPQNDRHL